MSKYPFYDILNQKIKDKDLTHKQKTDLIKKISKLDQDGKELLYAIIKIHSLKTNESFSTFKIPFSGTYNNNSVQFNLENFSYPLKQIIFKFVPMHLKKMREDKKKLKKNNSKK